MVTCRSSLPSLQGTERAKIETEKDKRERGGDVLGRELPRATRDILEFSLGWIWVRAATGRLIHRPVGRDVWDFGDLWWWVAFALVRTYRVEEPHRVTKSQEGERDRQRRVEALFVAWPHAASHGGSLGWIERPGRGAEMGSSATPQMSDSPIWVQTSRNSWRQLVWLGRPSTNGVPFPLSK